MSLYNEIIKTGIVFRRPVRIISNLFSVFASGQKSSKPFILKFESSAVCNLKCKMCPLNIGLSRKKGVLKFKDFKKVFDETRPPYLNLTGIGEPLLNNDLIKIIRYARKKKSIVKLDTNATLLNDEKIKNLIDSNPTFLSVSMDGITKERYEKVRIGAKFEIVIKNLKKLIEYRNKKKSKTKIQLFFVMQKDNILDLPKFIDFGDKLKIDSLNGTIAIPMGKNKNKSKLKINERDFQKVRKELKEIKKNININLNITGIEDFLKNPEDISKKDKPCFWPWYQAAITWDGYMTPCCIYCDNEIVFGNVFRENFMNVWNNKKARKFRENLVKGRTGVCADCGVDESFIFEKFKPIYKIPLINKLSERK